MKIEWEIGSWTGQLEGWPAYAALIGITLAICGVMVLIEKLTS